MLSAEESESTTLEQSQVTRGPAQPTRTPEFHEYRAPREHGEALISPSLSQASALIRDNQALLRTHAIFDSLRSRARGQLIDDAIRYTSSYRDVSWLDRGAAVDRPILMAGHQPAIFHAGVWFKNFALSHLAGATGSTAVNLVIDNDVASGSTVRVPTLDPETRLAAYRLIPYDRAGGGVPYEQTTIDDREVFDRFDSEVREAVATLVRQPCVTQLWKHARTAIERCGVAGCALAQARHGLEGELGLRTLELPLGVVCRNAAFAEFVLMILGELPRFRRCYNDAAQGYRKAHHIRSSAHPVPDLAEDGDWFEAPLWIYGNDSPARKAAWARMSDDEIVISDRGTRELRFDVRYPKLAAEHLASLLGPNLKLRPRALLTTMYSRLVLSDLFLHGIGGGKYDQLGDMITRSFFMIEPPRFMVVSATVKLPGRPADNSAEALRGVQRALRDTEYQPERFADRFELDSGAMRRKQELLAAVPERGNRRQWHQELERVNQELSRPLQPFRDQLRDQLTAARRRAASNSLLSSREHPFCVFPLNYLVETYGPLLR